MRKLLLLISFIFSFLLFNLLISGNCYSQNGTGFTSVFEYNGQSFNSRTVLQAYDGNYIAVALSNIPNAHFFIFKIANDGTVIWSKQIEMAPHDFCLSMCETASGNYLLSGSSYPYPPSIFSLAEVDTGGNLIRCRRYNFPGCPLGNTNGSMIRTTGNGFAVTGSTVCQSQNDSLFILSFDSSLNPLWYREFYGVGDSRGKSIIQTADGGFIIAGTTEAGGWLKAYIVKLDALGNQQWARKIGDTLTHIGANAIIQKNNGDYVLTGQYKFTANGDYDLYLAELDSSGNLLWTKIFGFPSENIGYAMVKTSDGGYTVAGNAFSFPSYGACVLKFDSNDSLQWSVMNDSTMSGSVFVPYCIIQTQDHGYALSGSKGSYYGELLKLDSLGMNCTMMPVTFTQDTGGILTNAGMIVPGNFTLMDTIGSMTTINITATVNCIATSVPQTTHPETQMSVSPNPASEELKIINAAFKIKEIEIYDLFGRKVLHSTLNSQQSTFTINISSLSPGIYFLKAGNEVKKFVKE